MSTKPEYNFVWSDGALIPASLTINFPIFNERGIPVEEGDSIKTEAVKFYELPRTDLVQFMEESLQLKVIETLDETEEREDPITGDKVAVPKTRKLPFTQVADEHGDLLFKYLAKMTNGAKDATYFKELPLRADGIAGLVQMFMEVNHVAEILATQGNWLMLPDIQRVLREPESKEA